MENARIINAHAPDLVRCLIIYDHDTVNILKVIFLVIVCMYNYTCLLNVTINDISVI